MNKQTLKIIRESAKAEARAELLGELHAQYSKKVWFGLFDQTSFLEDLAHDSKSELRKATDSQKAELSALAAQEIEQTARTMGAINPSIIGRAMEATGHTVRSVLDNDGDFTVLDLIRK